YRYFLVSSFIDECPSRIYCFPKIRILDGRIDDDIHGTLEDCVQILQQAEIRIGILVNVDILEAHQEIQIALRRVKSRSGCRAKEVNSTDMVLPADPLEFLAFLFYQFMHVMLPLAKS